MGVFIQNIRTRRYYAGHDQWPATPAEALTFDTPSLAREWIRAVKLSNVQVVFDTDSPPSAYDGQARLRE